MISRRVFMTAAAATAGTAFAQDRQWKLWARYVTGGAPYRPSFASMFLDPLFLEIEVIPSDLPNNLSITTASAARAGAAIPGRGQSGNAAPILADNPVDLPWIPSTQETKGIRSLLSGGAPVYTVLILNDQTDWPDEARASVQRNVEAGKGFVVIHNALGDNQKWTWWYQEMTGGLLALNDGNGMKKSTITHGATYEARPVGNHPIVRDLDVLHLVKETGFQGMWQSPKITPLLEARGQGTDHVVAWVGPNPKARVVCIQPGAASETHRNPVYRKLVRNAVLWAGGRLD